MFKTPRQRIIIRSAGIGFGAGVLVWFILLIHAAQTLHNKHIASHAIVRLGVFTLSTLSKIPIAGGYRVTFSITPSFMWFLGMLAVGGFALGYGVTLWGPLSTRMNNKKVQKVS